MSMSYWICQGIGFEMADALPLLDPEKVQKQLKEMDKELLDARDVQLNQSNEQSDWLKEFYRADDREKMNLLQELYCEEGLLNGTFIWADERNLLSVWHNGGGLFFVLYPPHSPWTNKDDFKSEDEAINYIAELFKKFSRDDVTREHILEIIHNDIYEEGCS